MLFRSSLIVSFIVSCEAMGAIKACKAMIMMIIWRLFIVSENTILQKTPQNYKIIPYGLLCMFIICRATRNKKLYYNCLQYSFMRNTPLSVCLLFLYYLKYVFSDSDDIATGRLFRNIDAIFALLYFYRFYGLSVHIVYYSFCSIAIGRAHV